MSLLLDALKPSESSAAESGESQSEDQEEALDARATLELLVPDRKQTVPDALALAPAAAPAREPATAAREPASPSPGYRATAAAPRPANKFSVLLMMLIVLGGVGLAVYLLWPKTYVVTYPESGESAAPAADGPQPEAASLHAVQVPPSRPADQFAYVGGAPEIDLHETSVPPPAVPKPAPPAAPAESAPPLHRPAVAANFSVTRTESESAIYRHVKAGYQALASGNVATAQREYLAALEIDANSVDALLGAAAAAARDGKPAVASAAYAKVLKLEPGNPDATAAIAMLNHDAAAGEYNESHLKILIASDGATPALHAALGGVYAADRRWSEAAQEYFSALAKDPGNPDLAFDVAASLDQNRNAVMALNFYQQALGFARQRPAQFDVRAVEERVSRLQAKAGTAHTDAASGAEAR